MAAPQSQHRCVFVGNIPYDATEEQLKEICEEVGPVVSFRLVVDRETGKPKGYGFCEYKDDETAASARRNLSGYEINGRQLRVDFAENGKNVADKNREQGRGGPGMASTADHQKQFGGSAVLGDATLHQPLGVSVAVAGAALMAQALGGAQNVSMLNHLGNPSQQVLGSDPLTLHLARMSKNQLSEIISEIKDMATQNKEQARQVLLAYPNLTKALFQAQLILGIVPSEMLQMPNIRQISAQPLQPVLRDGVQAQVSAFQTLPGLLPAPQNRGQYNSLSVQETPVPVGHSVSVLPNQPAALPQFSIQPQIQLPQLVQNNILHPGQLSGPSIRPQPQSNLSFRPHQVANSSILKQTIQPSLLQDPLQVTSSTHVQPFQSAHSQIPDQNVQHNSLLPGVEDIYSKDPRRQVSNTRINATVDPRHHPSKLVRLNNGKSVPSSLTIDMETLGAGPSQNFSTAANQVSGVDKTLVSEKQATQMELPPEVDSALLQQVLQLTPEQLSSLPPDQQQQVRQLQEMLRQQSTQLRN